MEIVLRVRQGHTLQFSFLMPTDRLHPYFRWVLQTDPQVWYFGCVDRLCIDRLCIDRLCVDRLCVGRMCVDWVCGALPCSMAP